MTNPVHVDAVILAAGQSTRMGQPKALLEVGSETFLERAIRMLRFAGCRHIVAVLPAEEEWTQRLADATGAAIVINDDIGSQQIDSLRIGMHTLPDDWSAVAVLPVDIPLIADSTAKAIIDDVRATLPGLTIPFHNGVAGHPVVIGRQLESEVMEMRWEEGLRSLIMKHSRDLHEIRVVDPAILIDIDTKEDYWRYVQEKNR
ncbi:MAG: nucleotidyltransferase family protein [Longimicrobiales bacterium]